MKNKTLLIGMIAVMVLSICGCRNDNKENITEADTESLATESVSTIEETMKTMKSTTEAVTESAESQMNQEFYENLYCEILDSNYKLITGGKDNFEYTDGTSGIGEIVRNDDGSVADVIGYTFLDINKDGVAELIIGSISEEEDGKYYGQNIYSGYTYYDTPHLLIEGWSRNRCFLLDDGTFYTEGSGGAMYSVFVNYVLEAKGTELTYNDYYFTKEKDEFFEEIGFYHNTSGEWDASVSEELGEDEYWNKSVEYNDKIRTLEFIPFSMYQYSEG